MSLRDLARRSGVPHTTVGDLLNPRRTRLPRLDVVTAVVRACGADESQVLAWQRRWRELHAAADTLPVAATRADHCAPMLVPAQLPMGLSDFTGRATEITAMRANIEDAVTRAGVPRLVVVTGPAGTGKTTLAVHVAHSLRDSHPDGQLYANLRGTSPTPATPMQVLQHFLHALGFDPASVPQHEDTLAATYRSLMAHRRILVLLDDATAAAQVRPLLPADPGCTVIVTSRDHLTNLDNANHITIDALQPDQTAEPTTTTTDPTADHVTPRMRPTPPDGVGRR
jgi:hypothetical protein